jgi:BirA family biotin operon repressor/biotin-[acetyl-CoA-carboxylase] ligase
VGITGNSLSPASIINNLETQFVGQRVIYYPSLTSTMEVAKRKAQRGAAEGTVIIAGEQTAGKGRIKRPWLSPRGNIALSIILYPSVVYLTSLIMLASLAVVYSIESVTGLKPQLKWPNDVLINGRKVCGILIESDVRGNRVDYTIIGIGINVNLRLADFPEISPIATSLSDELGRELPCLDLIQRLLVEIEKLYLALTSGESIYELWRDRLVTLGRRVEVRWGKTIYEGIAESVARDGSLLLRRSDKSLTKIVAGDVTLRDCE